MNSARYIAVIDIGKTNAKLVLVDPTDMREVEVITRPNDVLPGPPWPHFDVEGHWAFLLQGLRDFHQSHGVAAITVTTHGACVALLDHSGNLAAPILDYEHSGPDSVADLYAGVRPAFEETGSPQLPGGLNVGAQLFWQLKTDPALGDRIASIVTYPQYWGHRLTGVAATDVTSLGCHTDLWNPYAGQFSSLTRRLNLDGKIADPLPSDAVIGTLRPGIAARTGLCGETPVYCGIHDSNASLLPHLYQHQEPFSVLSTGTWCIAMSVGGKHVIPDPGKDTLINVSALGNPVPSARFMGGREHDLALDGRRVRPSRGDMAMVLRDEVMLFPGLAPLTGPFRGMRACWSGHEPEKGTGVRTVAVDYYLALVASHCLDLIGHDGPVIVEGPFAQNEAFLEMLLAATGAQIIASHQLTGTSQGAALLVGQGRIRNPEGNAPTEVADDVRENLARYSRTWNRALRTRAGAQISNEIPCANGRSRE